MHQSPLSPFGLEVTGLDTSKLTPAIFASVALLIARARVVVFRNQFAGDAALVKFLQGLGPLIFTAGETPVENAPDLNVVSNVGRTTPARSVFHTDTSYVRKPPAFTALSPVVLPPEGGDTLFSDQVLAASALPEKTRDFLMGRDVLHQASGLAGQGGAVRQPLLRRHVLTDETALYLSTPERCFEMSGVDAKTSQRIIAALYRHSTKPSKLYRHQWMPGDLLIWDNRVAMHRADHGNSLQERVLHRGMVMGEVPVFA